MAKWRILFITVVLSATASSQGQFTPEHPPPPRVRLSQHLSYNLADRKELPDIADLRGRQLDAEVAAAVRISKTGNVTAARAFKGDPKLFKRSEDAAFKWHYKPYVLNGYPIEADTTIEFHFTKDKVEVVVPAGPQVCPQESMV
jgi:Gram-negative bacterial TonB protein C-terminal